MLKKLCECAYREFNELAYERLVYISVSHIYNLRRCADYKKYRCHYEKTKSPKGIHIGERRKPRANGQPGYIRIDTVHQGDLDGKKGVYHINAVDEVTQFEVVVSVEKISEAYLIPALEELFAAFPFTIINFHSDNVPNQESSFIFSKIFPYDSESHFLMSQPDGTFQCLPLLLEYFFNHNDTRSCT